jgi:hypothetical protein
VISILVFLAIAVASALAVHAASTAVSSLLRMPPHRTSALRRRTTTAAFFDYHGAETVVDFDHVTRDWVRVASHPVGVGESHGLWHQGEIWTIGGYPTSTTDIHNVHRFQPSHNRWLAGPPLPGYHVHHTFTSCFSVGHKIVSVGGLRGNKKAKRTTGNPVM